MPRTSNKVNKLHIKKGDTVKVISGSGRGKTGRVLQVLVTEQRAIVEGIKMITKHVKPNQAYPNGTILKQEAPIHVSNLQLLDPKSNAPTRIGRKKDEKGNVQRISRKSGEVIK